MLGLIYYFVAVCFVPIVLEVMHRHDRKQWQGVLERERIMRYQLQQDYADLWKAARRRAEPNHNFELN